MSKANNNVRSFSWKNTNLPLTSKRARVMLSHPDSSKELVGAIRKQRRGDKSVSFKVSKEVTSLLNE